MSTTFVLIESQRIARLGLRAILDARDDFEILSEGAQLCEAPALVDSFRPDIAIIEDPPLAADVLQTIQVLREQCPETAVMVLSMRDERGHVVEALQAGAKGYMLKTSPIERLTAAADALAQDKSYVDPAVAAKLAEAYARTGDSKQSAFGILTRREREVLSLIADGWSSRAIGERLGLSCKTVDSHRHNLMSKLKLHKVAHLVRYAIREGITTP